MQCSTACISVEEAVKLQYSLREKVHPKIVLQVTLFAVFLPGNIVPQDTDAAGNNEMCFSDSDFLFQCIKQLFKLLNYCVLFYKDFTIIVNN